MGVLQTLCQSLLLYWPWFLIRKLRYLFIIVKVVESLWAISMFEQLEYLRTDSRPVWKESSIPAGHSRR